MPKKFEYYSIISPPPEFRATATAIAFVIVIVIKLKPPEIVKLKKVSKSRKLSPAFPALNSLEQPCD